jgi:hypothetical protein
MNNEENQNSPTYIRLYHLAQRKPVYGHQEKREMKTEQLNRGSLNEHGVYDCAIITEGKPI